MITVFLLINAPGAMQNINREPLFFNQFTKQKVRPILYFRDVYFFPKKPRFLRVCSESLLKTQWAKEKCL